MATLVETPTASKIEVIPGCVIREFNPVDREFIRRGDSRFRLASRSLNATVLIDPFLENITEPHPNSEVDYRFTTYNGLTKDFIGHIRPFRKTSRHYHPPLLSESYRVIGEFFVWTEDEGMHKLVGCVRDPARLTIRAGIEHFGFTLSKPALTIIELYNAKVYPEEEQHIRR